MEFRGWHNTQALTLPLLYITRKYSLGKTGAKQAGLFSRANLLSVRHRGQQRIPPTVDIRRQMAQAGYAIFDATEGLGALEIGQTKQIRNNGFISKLVSQVPFARK